MDATIQLLKDLTEAHGVPGNEGPVREVARRYLGPLGQLSQDKIGSLICRKAGGADAPRLMLAGHMDEVGFMVKLITKEGFLKFIPLGGWFSQVLQGQRVIVKTHKGDVVGVIGARPPHILSTEERAKVVPLKEMYIDVGATNQGEVIEMGVRTGDPVVPRADFVELAGGKTYLSKAFDDRVGVALMVSVLQALQGQNHPNTVYAAATVMEEFDLSGGRTSVSAIDPDVALVLESDVAGDVPGVSAEESTIRLGGGPTVLFYDARMIPNLKLRDLVMDQAKALGIPVQTSTLEGGATDGMPIHLHKSGVPTVVIGVASRHIHSHSSIMHRADYDAAVKLVTALVMALDGARVAGLTG